MPVYPGMEVKAYVELSAAATTITASNLDLDRDKIYHFIAVVQGSGNASANLRLNGSTTSGTTQTIDGNSSTASATTSSDNVNLNCDSGDTVMFTGTLVLPPNDKAICHCVGSNPVDPEIVTSSFIRADTTNITSIGVNTGNAELFAVGSWIKVYKG